MLRRLIRRLSVALPLLVLVLPAWVRAQENVFTPHHVAKLRMVLSAAVSPEGAQIAYVLGVQRQLPKEKDGPAWAELYVVDARGNSTPFVTGQVNVEAVAWTPDGKNISFLAKRDKDEYKALYLIGVRGGEARKIVSHGSDIHSYSWSPSGKQVAFLATEPEAKERKTLKDQGFSQETYEEDVQRVRVWIATPDDGKSAQAGKGESPFAAQALKLDGSASELVWSPKEDWLAVALAPTPLIDDHLMFRKVHLVNVKSGESFNLNNPGKMGQLAWSPDGKMIALVSGADKHDPKEGRLWIETKLRKGWTDLLPDFQGHVESIAWVDAHTLVYQASEGCWTTVGTIHFRASVIDGKVSFAHRKQHLPTGRPVPLGKIRNEGKQPAIRPNVMVKTEGPILGNVSAPAGNIQDLHARGTSLAFIAQTPAHPPEVYFIGPDDKEPRRLTDSNPWLRTMRFAQQEVVKHKARDGLELEGILVRPLGEKKGQRYPLVMTVHGGPEAHVSNGWTTLYHSLGQVGAARGMAVFYPNYRGSTGRGVDFSMMGQKEAAKKEFDDLVDAVDHLIGTGLVDAKKVGITGGSYGGYATAWGSTYYSDRFAAGVMFVGISNSISKMGTTDIPWEMYLVHHRKWLWDDWDYYIKSSPISYTDRAKTPLLILHGKADPRVHPSQSLELYRHLKLRGQAPVRLIFYPGEGHGNRRAASRLDYNLRLLQWMEHYLKTPGGPPPPLEIDYGLNPAAKTAALGTQSWHRRSEHTLVERAALDTAEALMPWLGRACPCCIGP